MYDRTFYFLLAETWDVFYGWQILYIWRKCRTSEDFFDLYISLKAQFFSFHFFSYIWNCGKHSHTHAFIRQASHYVWFHQNAKNSDTPILTGFKNCVPTWEWNSQVSCFASPPKDYHARSQEKNQYTRSLDFHTGLFCRTEWLQARMPRVWIPTQLLPWCFQQTSEPLCFDFPHGVVYRDLMIKYSTCKTTLKTMPGTKWAINHYRSDSSPACFLVQGIGGGSWLLILIAGGEQRIHMEGI